MQMPLLTIWLVMVMMYSQPIAQEVFIGVLKILVAEVLFTAKVLPFRIGELQDLDLECKVPQSLTDQMIFIVLGH